VNGSWSDPAVIILFILLMIVGFEGMNVLLREKEKCQIGFLNV
jgi:hypothetical protein